MYSLRKSGCCRAVVARWISRLSLWRMCKCSSDLPCTGRAAQLRGCLTGAGAVAPDGPVAILSLRRAAQRRSLGGRATKWQTWWKRGISMTRNLWRPVLLSLCVSTAAAAQEPVVPSQPLAIDGAVTHVYKSIGQMELRLHVF